MNVRNKSNQLYVFFCALWKPIKRWRQTFRRAALYIRKIIIHTKDSILNVTISRIVVTLIKLVFNSNFNRLKINRNSGWDFRA